MGDVNSAKAAGFKTWVPASAIKRQQSEAGAEKTKEPTQF
jgi:hypothetical protein